MKASTIANALSIVKAMRSAAVTGKTEDFHPMYTECCAVERELESALRKIEVPIENANSEAL